MDKNLPLDIKPPPANQLQLLKELYTQYNMHNAGSFQVWLDLFNIIQKYDSLKNLNINATFKKCSICNIY